MYYTYTLRQSRFVSVVLRRKLTKKGSLSYLRNAHPINKVRYEKENWMLSIVPLFQVYITYVQSKN